MFYYLFNWINRSFSPPGGDLFRYLTFRSALAAFSALVISMWSGPKIIAQVTVWLILSLTIMFSTNLFKYAGVDITTATTVPFFKNLVFEFGPVLYILFVILVITATSNAVNLTDGLDGLAAGTVAIA